jgi:hypothetical protein
MRSRSPNCWPRTTHRACRSQGDGAAGAEPSNVRADRTASRRPPVAFVVWGRVGGRAEEIAAALGGEAKCVWFGRLSGGPVRTTARYVVSAVVTAAYLVRRRPGAVIATNPPVVPGILAAAYARATGAPFALDSHPSAFGRKGDRVSARLRPVHRWLARRAAATFVTTRDWVDEVESWGGVAVVVHEAPSAEAFSPQTTPPGGRRPRVAFLGVFGADEPVAEIVDAARRLPDIDFDITGDRSRAAPDLVRDAPANVRFVGFLAPEAYRRVLTGADVVLSLTTEPTSVMRTAYEAVYACRPLVTSDWPALRELFPHAIAVTNDGPSIALGIEQAVRDNDRLAAVASTARAEQLARWDGQLDAVRDVLWRAPRENATGRIVADVVGIGDGTVG